MEIRYPAVLEPEAGGDCFMRFVNVEGAMTDDETLDEALFNASEAARFQFPRNGGDRKGWGKSGSECQVRVPGPSGKALFVPYRHDRSRMWRSRPALGKILLNRALIAIITHIIIVISIAILERLRCEPCRSHWKRNWFKRLIGPPAGSR